MLQTFKNGQGSIVLRVKLLDSSVATGAGLTGLTSASSGLIISTIADNEAAATVYTTAGSTVESITTLGTFAAPTATKCRFKEVDATNHKGVYELQIADARFAVSAAKSLLVSIAGVTNLAQADLVVQLQSDDPYVAKPTNFALTSIDSNGRVDIIKVAGTAQTARDLGASVLLSSGTGTGQVSLSSGAVKIQSAFKVGQALPNFRFTMVDNSDVLTTGLAITASRALNGGAHSAGTLSSITEIGSGEYSVDLATGDMNGATVVLKFVASGAKTLEVTLFPEP